MKRCTKCVTPETHETIMFDKQGVCNICSQIEYKKTKIDWNVKRKELDELVEAVLPLSFGAKLTGAGGGGCIISLSDKPEECAEAIRELGGVPYVTSFAENGVKIST